RLEAGGRLGGCRAILWWLRFRVAKRVGRGGEKSARRGSRSQKAVPPEGWQSAHDGSVCFAFRRSRAAWLPCFPHRAQRVRCHGLLYGIWQGEEIRGRLPRELRLASSLTADRGFTWLARGEGFRHS